MYDQAWLRTNVGPPSGNWGSTYTKIYELTGAYSRSRQLATLERLLELVNHFTWSPHTGATTPAAREAKAMNAIVLNEFRTVIQIERHHRMGRPTLYRPAQLARMVAQGDEKFVAERQMIDTAIAEMTTSTNPLIRNTGLGLTTPSLRKPSIAIKLGESGGGSMSIDNILTVSAVVAYNKLALIGLLVHEYHHHLCSHGGAGDVIYVDEFVAHYKQYTITQRPMSDAARAVVVNQRLTDLYRSQVDRWTRHHRLLTGIAQAGEFQVPNNAEQVREPHHAAIPV